MAKDEWEDKFENWRKEKKKKVVVSEKKVSVTSARKYDTTPSARPRGVEKVEVSVYEEKESAAKKDVQDYRQEPKHVNVLKVIIWLIPLVILGYLVISNFLVDQEFVHVYDIGIGEEGYLTPAERISEVVVFDAGNYRELTGGLVYFDAPIPRGAERIYVEARIKDNLPEGAKISLGAKDQEEWHYLYNLLYDPEFNLEGFDSVDGVYRINENLELLDLEELKEQEGIVIATNGNFEAAQREVEDYIPIETVIDTALRGSHTFYIYAEGDLEVQVTKQDINWYEGADDLNIILYDASGEIMKDTRIADDGIIGVDKESVRLQSGVLRARNLETGVYKLEFKDFDGLIREIRLNTNKIVAEKLFLGGNKMYGGVETETSKIYFRSDGGRQVRFHTYHAEGIQNVGMEIDGEKSFAHSAGCFVVAPEFECHQ
ncbi:MAG: hypothetical protein ABIH92_00460 [Nanoarchaeota archaeon]